MCLILNHHSTTVSSVVSHTLSAFYYIIYICNSYFITILLHNLRLFLILYQKFCYMISFCVSYVITFYLIIFRCVLYFISILLLHLSLASNFIILLYYLSLCLKLFHHSTTLSLILLHNLYHHSTTLFIVTSHTLSPFSYIISRVSYLPTILLHNLSLCLILNHHSTTLSLVVSHT